MGGGHSLQNIEARIIAYESTPDGLRPVVEFVSKEGSSVNVICPQKGKSAKVAFKSTSAGATADCQKQSDNRRFAKRYGGDVPSAVSH
jgi:hypothetical protein